VGEIVGVDIPKARIKLSKYNLLFVKGIVSDALNVKGLPSYVSAFRYYRTFTYQVRIHKTRSKILSET
jgi:hypothetical protein